MLTEISEILSNLEVNYDVPRKYNTYEVGNIQENRVVSAFNLAANGEFRAMATSELYEGDHVKNRDLGDIIIIHCKTFEVVASIDLKVATYSTDPEIYGPISMSSAYNFTGWNKDRKNTFYMLVNGGKHDKVRFISVNKVRELLDTGKAKVLLTKNPNKSNRVSIKEYESLGWDKNIIAKNIRPYLVDEDYIAARDLFKYTSDVMC